MDIKCCSVCFQFAGDQCAVVVERRFEDCRGWYAQYGFIGLKRHQHDPEYREHKKHNDQQNSYPSQPGFQKSVLVH